MAVKPTADEVFLTLLEKSVRDVLKDKSVSANERLRAIETGAKLLAIKHKINSGAEGDSYFNKQ